MDGWISGISFSWLSPNSLNSQYIRIHASIPTVLFGVIYGSILGPLLFILYTSVTASRHDIEIHRYADDNKFCACLWLNEVAKDCTPERMTSSCGVSQCASDLTLNNPSSTGLTVSLSRYSVLNSHSILPPLLSSVSTVQNHGVMLDSVLFVKPQIAAISLTCFFNQKSFSTKRAFQPKKLFNQNSS